MGKLLIDAVRSSLVLPPPSGHDVSRSHLFPFPAQCVVALIDSAM